MGALLQSFTFDRNTFRRTAEESADSVAEHIGKVQSGETLDKTASNIVGALASYMGIFAKDGGKHVPTRLANVFLKLYAANKADSWRWLVARSLWRFVVPNGTACKVNTPAKIQEVKLAFFHLIIQVLTHLAALDGEKRYLYFEELCKLLDDDGNWKLTGTELFALLIKARSGGASGFGSQRSFLGDLENTSDTEQSEFKIPRDNFSGLFLKAFAQTGFFEFRGGEERRKVALAIAPDLDAVLQRRLRFILDHPPSWSGTDWAAYMDIQTEDLPEEVSREDNTDLLEPLSEPAELIGLIRAAKADFDSVSLSSSENQLLRLAASLQSKRFLILTGLAGSGKTKLAQAFARWITPATVASDPFAPGSKVESERTTYYVNASDKIAVEFWNSENEEEATKVTLPRDMIEEWASYIATNAISKDTPARDIREAVKGMSKFSDQLHSFETHLKAAAFALLQARDAVQIENCYEVVPVGADWTGNENVLGYPDGLDRHRYVIKPALDLVLHAKSHSDIPHFLILDEMNLSHVERYFADILSAIESEEEISLYHDAEKKANGKPVPDNVALPKNLFIIGTVNVDETTYMFSPKVLDRANVVEFRMNVSEFKGFLSNPAKPDLSELDGKGASFGRAFVDLAKGPGDVPADVKDQYEKEMLLFFHVLREFGAEFGYRVAHEAARFIYFYKLLGNHGDGDLSWFPGAFDCVVVQKFLPKLHGSQAKIGKLLKALWFLTTNPRTYSADMDENARIAAKALELVSKASASSDAASVPLAPTPGGAPYPLSAEKINRMWQLLKDNGFASFAEA